MGSLPINRRGEFFKDAYFHDFHNDFGNAMDKVMDKFGGRSLLADQFTNSRKLKRENSEVAATASISDTADNYIIVLDMSDFLSGSITVCTSGMNAVVEANFEKKKFCKKFPLPKNCNLDGVKSAMSDEGILTINAPKKASRKVEMSTKDGTPEEPPEASCNAKEEDKVDANNGSQGNITVECLNLTNKMEPPASPTIPQTPTETRRVSIDKRGNFFQDSKFESVWGDFEKSMEDMMKRENLKSRERDQAKAERRAQRDAVFDKLTKQFFTDGFQNKRDNFFENEAKGYEDNFFKSKNRKQKSFEEDLNNIRDQFFGTDSPNRKNDFFDEELTKAKGNFFGDDFSRRKENFFETDSTRRRDKFFDDDAKKKRGDFFSDDAESRRHKFFDNDSISIDSFFKDDICRKKDAFFNDDSHRRKNDIFKDGHTKRTERPFDNAETKQDSDRRSEKHSDDNSDFESASSDIPNRFRKYRNLRNWDPTADTQAVSVKQSSDCYKILLDAKDVDSTSLSVQAKDDGLLVSGGDGRNAFKRKFSLPGAINFDKVNANLSEDGILIITIPKN